MQSRSLIRNLSYHFGTRKSLCVTAVAVAATLGVSAVTAGKSSAAYGNINGKIAFTKADGQIGQSYTDIYVMDADGQNNMNLTSAAVGEANFLPRWSPDGKKILFTKKVDVTAKEDLIVMNADGSGKTALTATLNQREQDGAWSPDGKQIAYVKEFRIYVMNADGSNSHPITSGASGNGLESTPTWSPDGKKIAFSKATNIFQEDIFVVNLDGTNMTNLTNTDTLYETMPAWSPDGQKIAFSDPIGSKLFVINASDGANRMQIPLPVGRKGTSPAWSPDGKQLLFTDFFFDGNSEIFRVNLDQPDSVTQLTTTNNPVSNETPVWQPLHSGSEQFVEGEAGGSTEQSSSLSTTRSEISGTLRQTKIRLSKLTFISRRGKSFLALRGVVSPAPTAGVLTLMVQQKGKKTKRILVRRLVLKNGVFVTKRLKISTPLKRNAPIQVTVSYQDRTAKPQFAPSRVEKTIRYKK